MSPEISIIPEADVLRGTEGSTHTTVSLNLRSWNIAASCQRLCFALKKILEAIFEQDFIDTSYGFRPNRSCHDALIELNRIIMTAPVNFVVDMDISKFVTQV